LLIKGLINFDDFFQVRQKMLPQLASRLFQRRAQ
jgi:hypothetical protein